METDIVRSPWPRLLLLLGLRINIFPRRFVFRTSLLRAFYAIWMNEWFVEWFFISTSRSQDWITGCGQEQLRNNKHNYYNLYYACLKYIEFWLITKYILRIFISDEIPKSKCVVWDFRLTFMSQIIWLVHPHSTVMFYNMIKWVIGFDTFNESATSVGSSGNQCS